MIKLLGSTDGSLQTCPKRRSARGSEGQEWRRFFHQTRAPAARPAQLKCRTARRAHASGLRERTNARTTGSGCGSKPFLISAAWYARDRAAQGHSATTCRNAGPLHPRRVRGLRVSTRVVSRHLRGRKTECECFEQLRHRLQLKLPASAPHRLRPRFLLQRALPLGPGQRTASCAPRRARITLLAFKLPIW